MSLANISIVGNVVKAPEQVQFTTGTVKTNLHVAVNNPPAPGKDKGTADFYQVELWGKQGELACKYLSKGNQVAISGRFQLNRWQDREGKERVTPVVHANQISFPPRLKVVSDNEALHSGLSEETESTVMVAEPSAAYEVFAAEPNDTIEFGDTESSIESDYLCDEFPKQRAPAPV